jgi:hypothetical protein
MMSLISCSIPISLSWMISLRKWGMMKNQSTSSMCAYYKISFFGQFFTLFALDPTELVPYQTMMLSYLPRSVLVAFIAVPVGILMISGVALWKSTCMLLKGWQRLYEDLVGREGPFLETVCVPFSGLAIVLWPLAVIGAVITSFLCSFFSGFCAGLIAYQVCLASR